MYLILNKTFHTVWHSCTSVAKHCSHCRLDSWATTPRVLEQTPQAASEECMEQVDSKFCFLKRNLNIIIIGCYEGNERPEIGKKRWLMQVKTWQEKVKVNLGQREDMRSSTEAEQNTRKRRGWWWKLDGGKLRTNANPGVEALSAGSIYSPASRCWSCHSQCALQPVSPAAR